MYLYYTFILATTYLYCVIIRIVHLSLKIELCDLVKTDGRAIFATERSLRTLINGHP